MHISDTDVLEFQLVALRHDKIDLDPAEARQRLFELTTLFKRFASWIAKEEAAGRTLSPCEHPHVSEGTEPTR